jgi:hypothetical protein
MAFTTEYALNFSDPNEAADCLRKLRTGTMLRGMIKQQTEVLLAVANVVTLSRRPASTPIVYVTAGGATGPFTVIPAGVAPAAGEVACNPDAHTLTFNAADAVVAVAVQYNPLPSQADHIDSTWPHGGRLETQAPNVEP